MNMLIAGCILTLAAYGDWREHRIANQWIIVGWCAGVLWRLWEGGMQSLGIGLAVWIIPVIIGWPLYYIGGIGAGDIKLCSVISLFCGLRFLGKVLVIMSVIAGLLSLIQLGKTAELRQRCICLLQYLLERRYLREKYYRPSAGDRGRVIPLAPVTWIAYMIVLTVQIL